MAEQQAGPGTFSPSGPGTFSQTGPGTWGEPTEAPAPSGVIRIKKGSYCKKVLVY